MEEWKDIKGYEGLYQVSTLGRVRTLPRISCQGHPLKGGYLKPRRCPNGYLNACLSKDGTKSYKLIHRLVAQAFIDNPHDYPQVNHKDEDVTNNHVDNLEWCTNRYNSNYGNHNLRLSESLKGHRRSAETIEKHRHKMMKKVMCVETGEIFDSIKSAEAFTHTRGICEVLHGRSHRCGGYHWRYA